VPRVVVPSYCRVHSCRQVGSCWCMNAGVTCSSVGSGRQARVWCFASNTRPRQVETAAMLDAAVVLTVCSFCCILAPAARLHSCVHSMVRFAVRVFCMLSAHYPSRRCQATCVSSLCVSAFVVFSVLVPCVHVSSSSCGCSCGVQKCQWCAWVDAHQLMSVQHAPLSCMMQL
jgi:hypothetical protein